MRMSDWSSDVCSSDLGPGRRNPLQLLDLRVLQLDRRRAPEDRHRDLEARALLVDLLAQAVERGEGAVAHPHLLPDLDHARPPRPHDALLHPPPAARALPRPAPPPLSLAVAPRPPPPPT